MAVACPQVSSNMFQVTRYSRWTAWCCRANHTARPSPSSRTSARGGSPFTSPGDRISPWGRGS